MNSGLGCKNYIKTLLILFETAIQRYGCEVVDQHGHLPWAILNVHRQLIGSFKRKDVAHILKHSADLGHYIADACVPLHTTQNYDGQMSGQEGIHAFWETRLPLLFFDTYNLFVGSSSYIANPLAHIWKIIRDSHALVPILLNVEKQLSSHYAAISKYSFEQEGNMIKKQYAYAFSMAYHKALEGQVEQCVQHSIREVGNFWFTAWINAGSPCLDNLEGGLPQIEKGAALLSEKKLQEKVRACGDE